MHRILPNETLQIMDTVDTIVLHSHLRCKTTIKALSTFIEILLLKSSTRWNKIVWYETFLFIMYKILMKYTQEKGFDWIKENYLFERLSLIWRNDLFE